MELASLAESCGLRKAGPEKDGCSPRPNQSGGASLGRPPSHACQNAVDNFISFQTRPLERGVFMFKLLEEKLGIAKHVEAAHPELIGFRSRTNRTV